MCGVLVKLLKLSGANGMPRLQPIAKGPMGPRDAWNKWVKMDVWICLGCPPVILLGRTFHKISGHISATITSAFCTAMLYNYGRVGRQALLSGCSIPTELNSWELQTFIALQGRLLCVYFFWKRQSHTSGFSLLIKRRQTCCKFSRVYAGMICSYFLKLFDSRVRHGSILGSFPKIRGVSQLFLWDHRRHRPGRPYV